MWQMSPDPSMGANPLLLLESIRLFLEGDRRRDDEEGSTTDDDSSIFTEEEMMYEGDSDTDSEAEEVDYPGSWANPIDLTLEDSDDEEDRPRSQSSSIMEQLD